uniref:Ovule protein n=1 Tax=Schistosoma mansoni TaxID=6183 RepID=A0A5K4F6L6_SCHMA
MEVESALRSMEKHFIIEAFSVSRSTPLVFLFTVIFVFIVSLSSFCSIDITTYSSSILCLIHSDLDN